MQTTFIVISSILTVVCTIPYIVDILRDKTKPRIVSWLTWALLTAIATAASLADGQYASAILTAFATLESGSIVVLGLVKHGKASFARFDLVCQVLAMVGFALWFVFNSPAVAIVAVIAIDLVASMPTVRRAWQAPHEETLLEFLLAGIAGIFTVLAVAHWQITSVAYPLYIVGINLLTVGVMIVRHKRLSSKPDPEAVKL